MSRWKPRPGSQPHSNEIKWNYLIINKNPVIFCLVFFLSRMICEHIHLSLQRISKLLLFAKLPYITINFGLLVLWLFCGLVFEANFEWLVVGVAPKLLNISVHLNLIQILITLTSLSKPGVFCCLLGVLYWRVTPIAWTVHIIHAIYCSDNIFLFFFLLLILILTYWLFSCLINLSLFFFSHLIFHYRLIKVVNVPNWFDW